MKPDKENFGFLMGAGASMEADIPTAYMMTKKLYERLTDRNKDLARLFGIVVTGLKHHKATDKKSDLFGELNIEEVVSAVELITKRNKLEIAPFVDRWSDVIEQEDRSHRTATNMLIQSARNFSGTIRNTLEDVANKVSQHAASEVEKRLQTKGHFWGSRFHGLQTYRIDSSADDFAQAIVNFLQQTSPDQGNFLRLYRLMHAILQDFMWLEDATKIEYLNPIAELAGKKTFPIFSLNYDNCIELLSEKKSFSFVDGFKSDNFESNWDLTGNGVRLYKLHGSINWANDHEKSKIVKVPTRPTENQLFMPEIIFGQREKLRNNGPFLDLLFEFKENLKSLDSLYVLGYSFADPHINRFLKQWIQLKGKKMFVANGPSFTFDKHSFFEDFETKNITNSKLTCGEILKAITS